MGVVGVGVEGSEARATGEGVAISWKGRPSIEAGPRVVPAPEALSPPPEAPPSQPQIGVFEHLIGSEEDVVGLIAYALYKHDKRDWMASWRLQHGSEPGREHFSGYVSANLTPGQRQRYRASARDVLDRYFSDHYDHPGAVDSEAAASASRLAVTMQHLEAGTSWKRTVLAGVLGAVAAAVVLIGVAFVLKLQGVGLFAAVVSGT